MSRRRGTGPVDPFEEGQHIHAGVLFAAFGDDLAGGNVQRREQIGGAMPLVVMVPARPGRRGRLGWVRSNAWHWVFSSKLNTTARCGGFRYRPTTSTSLASKSGSLEILKVSILRLEAVVPPDPGHGVLADPQPSGQRARRPMRGGAVGSLGQCHPHYLGHGAVHYAWCHHNPPSYFNDESLGSGSSTTAVAAVVDVAGLPSRSAAIAVVRRAVAPPPGWGRPGAGGMASISA